MSVNRKFTTYRAEHPETKERSEIRAHVVTDDTAGEVHTVGWGSQRVKRGNVLVATAHPNVYDVLPNVKALTRSGWSEGSWEDEDYNSEAAAERAQDEPESDEDEPEDGTEDDFGPAPTQPRKTASKARK